MESLLIQLLLAAAFLVTCSGEPACVAGPFKTYHPHEARCDQYYVCTPNGTLSHYQCPPTHMYDARDQVCRTPANKVVDCSHRPYSDPTHKTYLYPQRPQCKRNSPLQYHPHEYYCDHYYRCEKGVESIGLCPPREVFDHQWRRRKGELKCTADHGHLYNAKFLCVPNPLRSYPSLQWCPKKKKRVASDGRDCGVYWSCEGGEGVAKACHLAEVFDPSSATCQLPEKVDGAGKNCSLKNVIPAKCPRTRYEWNRFHYEQPALVPHPVRYYLESHGVPPLANPRYSWGHCRFYYECRVAEDGLYWPHLEGCADNLVLEPYSLQCVDASLVPQCRYYRSNYQLHVDYESKLRSGRF